MMRDRWRGVGVFLGVVLVGWSLPVRAQVRTAVLPFAGDGAATARAQVQTILEAARGVVPVELERVDSAARRVRASSESVRGIAELAEELGARLVVQGTVGGSGRRRVISLVSRDATGEAISSTSAEGTRLPVLRRAVTELLETSLALLPAPVVEAVEAAPVLTESASRIDAESAREAAPAEAADERPWDRRSAILTFQAGAVPRSREADVTFEDGQHSRYAAWYSEIGARAELRPLGADPGLGRGLYARGTFAHAVGLVTKVDTAGTEVPTTFFRADFALGYLLPIGETAELGLEFGAGWDTHTLGTNTLLESAEYVFVRPGLRGRIRLVREWLVLDVQGGVRPALSRGDWSRYGTGGDTLGFDLAAGLGGAWIPSGSVGLSWGVDLGWVSYGSSFTGSSTSPTAGKTATDGSVRVGLWAGIAVY